MSASLLVLGYGNPSRGDDAVGPLLIDYLSTLALSDTELLTDFQLQVEHVLDLENRSLVLFIDAAVSQQAAIRLLPVIPDPGFSISTHALTPQQLLGAYLKLSPKLPPACFLLAIKAAQFELGEDLSAEMRRHYQQACQFLHQMLDNPCPDYWQSLVTS